MQYDITVIGSGPGGYVAAIRAAQLGKTVAIIEKYNTLGGTCLNVGCIPSKALLDSSEHFHNAEKTFAEHGIKTGAVSVDMKQMVARKNAVVEQTTKGVEFLMKKNKIVTFTGVGSFIDKNNILITKADGSTEQIATDKVIIATGSKPIAPAMFNYDKKRVITSTEALNINKVPKRMVVVGAGVIGLELGSVFARLGTEVEVVEFQDRILAGMDKDCSKEMTRSLKKLGMKFHLKHGVTGVKATKTSVTVTVNKRDTEDTFEIKADYCLVAIGRYAYTDGLALDKVGISTDDRALGRARASMDVDGMIKVLADKETDELLGVHMVGARAADLIMEAVALMEFRASAEDMARICHPHPTYTEA
eukprot:maker-scaffold8930_size2563-snap-gene-0.0 protein:Tk00927 transcript:maker-scaffold8930_size2563-snap-gene-0.0-mRNA-1 annotation:"dihydrolipoamide dehydrogenase"